MMIIPPQILHNRARCKILNLWGTFVLTMSIPVKSIYLFACALACLIPLGCAHFRPEARDPEPHVTEAFTLYEHTAPAPERWWELFASEELNALVNEALTENLSLQQINARLLQAEMLALQSGAARFPDLNAVSDASITRRHMQLDSSVSDLDRTSRQLGAVDELINPEIQKRADDSDLADTVRSLQTRLQAAETLFEDAPPSSITTTTRSYRFGLASSYELDLWGRVRARHEAALLDVEVYREDLYAAMLSLSGTVARQWLTIAANRQVLELIQGQLDLNRKTLGLIEFRFTQGLATALDVFQQRQIVTQTEALVPAIQESIDAALFELAVLVGKPPQHRPEVAAAALPVVGGLPDPGLPADLLAHRPDVRAAGLQLQAADWRVSAARADRLPAVRLSAGASFGAEEWGAVFDNWMANLAGSLTGPIFDAGRRKAEVERTRAVAEERLAAYRLRILESMKEVEIAMMRETRQAEYVNLLKLEREAVNAAYSQAMQRYLNGVLDYLPVLTALTQMQTIERRLVLAEFTRLERRLQLCIALGGAWMAEAAETTRLNNAPVTAASSD